MVPGCIIGLAYGAIAAVRYFQPRAPFQLIAAGKVTELERRLLRGLDPDSPVPVKTKPGAAPNSFSLVYYSVISNQREALLLLLSHHANPNLTAKLEHTTPLLAAIRLKRSSLLDPLLDAGADPNLPDIFGNTPLLETVLANAPAAAARLLEAGADPNAATFDSGTTPLLVAARNGYGELVALLLAHGADANLASFEGGTPLMDSAYNDYPELCLRLLEAGADPEAQIAADKIAGSTALMHCAMHNRPGPARVLLDGGADPNARWSKNGATALHMCLTNGSAQVAQLLLDHGADPNAPNGRGTMPLHLLFRQEWEYPESVRLKLLRALLYHGADPAERDAEGRTALLHCLWDQPADVALLGERVGLLLKHGADPNTPVDDPSGRTPPITPLIMAAAWGDVPTALLLLDAGADAGYFPPYQGGYERSALDMAVRENHTAMVKLLLARGARFNPVAGSDCGALLHCIDADKPEMARLLLAAGASASSRLISQASGDDERHFPALGLAAMSNKPALLELLREFGATLAERTNWGATLLHLAAHKDALASIDYLLAAGADLEAPDDEGLRPLHEAAKTGSAAAVELLLKHGADPNARATFGRQPLDLLGYNYDNIDKPTYKRIERALAKAGAKLSASYT